LGATVCFNPQRAPAWGGVFKAAYLPQETHPESIIHQRIRRARFQAGRIWRKIVEAMAFRQIGRLNARMGAPSLYEDKIRMPRGVGHPIPASGRRWSV